MKDATHITLVIDRSGSMESIKADAQGAINSFVSEQKLVEGECTLALYDFDAPRGPGADDWFRQRYTGPIAGMHEYHLQPRGNTALLDAVALSMQNTGSVLAALPESERPDKVVFVIQTDGQENSSTRFSWDQVKEMIKVQTDEFNWQVIFLGMGPDSWDGGSKLGISNIVAAAATGISHDHTHSYLNSRTTAFRQGASEAMKDMAGTQVSAQGRVTNAAGDELDPLTGEVLDKSQTI
jgi:hypothetical protein